MFRTIPDLYRKLAVENLFSISTMKNCWPVWKSKLTEILGHSFNEYDILNLGDHLSEIFQTTGDTGRGQGSLSGGGAAWESLICLYINLCTIGSRIVAVRRMSLVPEAIRNAITVNYGNFACNTESDITIIIFPDTTDYKTDIKYLQELIDSHNTIPVIYRNKLSSSYLNILCKRDFNNYEIGIIQCKTNWNDNAQVPMLWDMIYSANGFRGRNITIGKEGFNIHQASNFSYSFVTVPTNRSANYNSESVAVKRVTNLSGGNYWGNPTISNVARSLKEIFTNNFQNGFAINIREDIKNALPYLNSELSYFNII